MYKKNITFAALSLALMTTMPVSSTELSYTNISMGYQAQTSDDLGFDLDSDGIRFDGSLAVTDQVFLRADYLSLRSDTISFGRASGVVDSAQFSVGLGFHFPVAANTDLVTTFSYANVEKDFLNTSIDEDGVIISGGIRSKPTDIVELGANVNYVDTGNKEDVGFGVTGRVFVLSVVSVGLSYDKLDNSDKFTVDLRYDF